MNGSASPPRQRTVVLVTPDNDLRERISQQLLNMRWAVLSAAGGAEAMAHLGGAAPEAMLVDHWLPDLDAGEFIEHAAAMCPGTDLIQLDGSPSRLGTRSARRNELLHALREAAEQDSSGSTDGLSSSLIDPSAVKHDGLSQHRVEAQVGGLTNTPSQRQQGQPNGTEINAFRDTLPAEQQPQRSHAAISEGATSCQAAVLPDIVTYLPDMVGGSATMAELGRMVRMVAPHTATVLIQGETGSGKELVAKAIHRLSARAAKPFVVLNCAAIPEHLLEAELFGHTRGAFTGAVTARTGRIEAANGGTLFLDEIGEMPLPLQAKMLRFLENGEIQRVGDNDVTRMDVRIVAATHQPLEVNAGHKLFRLDLYHRLAVFPVEVPPLRERREDLPMLVEFLLRKAAENAPRKNIEQQALDRLAEAPWHGNVRELSHVLQRAVIMAGNSPVITTEHLRMRSVERL